MFSDRPFLLGASLVGFLLAGCGDFPQPFRGDPGAEAQRLAAPPPARLAVTTPTDALLSDGAARDFASDLAANLQDNEIPAEAKHQPDRGDWRLVTRAEDRGERIVPIYAVFDPSGKDEGHIEGSPIPLADWADGSAAMLKAAAVDATPRITDLLRNIEAARMRSDPKSLYNRPAKVFVAPVSGAPGDGNTSLTVQMRRQLATHGELVQDNANGADFTVAGHVNAVPLAGGLLRVEIQWHMTDASGHDLGMVLQLNEVPPDTVRGYWGDVALAVAQEAAGGVHDTLVKDTGHTPSQAKGAPDVAPATTAPAPSSTGSTPADHASPQSKPAAGAAPHIAAAPATAGLTGPAPSQMAPIPAASPGLSEAAGPQGPAVESQ